MRKLAFPLYALLVVWSAGIPLHLLAVLFQLATASTAVQSLTVSGWAGVVALFVTLLSAGEPAGQSLDPATTQMRTMELVLRVLMVIGVGMIYLYLALSLWLNSGRWFFFGIRVPVGTVGILLSLLLGLAAVHRSRELMLGELASYRVTSALSLFGLTITLVLGVGALWHWLSGWGRWLVALVPVVILLSLAGYLHWLSRAGQTGRSATFTQKEDPWTPRELDWLTTRWTNALFLRDLRASLRTRSLLRRLLHAVLLQSLLLGVWFLTVKRIGGGSAGFVTCIFNPALNGSAVAATFWGKEKSSGTLSLLLITPLSSDEILLGRLVAALLVALPFFALPALLVGGGLGWLGTTRFWPFAFGALSQLPVILTVGVAFGCGSSTGGQKVTSHHYHPVFHVAQGGILLLIPCGVGAVVALARFGVAAACAASLVVGSLHVGFAAFVFREYVRKLDAYRREDVDPTLS